MAFLNNPAFDYDYRCTPLDRTRNGPTRVEIYKIATKQVVLAYTLPHSRKAWCDASATLVVIADSASDLAELQAHYNFAGPYELQ